MVKHNLPQNNLIIFMNKCFSGIRDVSTVEITLNGISNGTRNRLFYLENARKLDAK